MGIETKVKIRHVEPNAIYKGIINDYFIVAELQNSQLITIFDDNTWDVDDVNNVYNVCIISIFVTDKFEHTLTPLLVSSQIVNNEQIYWNDYITIIGDKVDINKKLEYDEKRVLYFGRFMLMG